MSADIRDRREVGGADRLDLELGSVQPASGPAPLVRFFRRRAAHGLAPGYAPALLFVPLGAVLGPSGLGLVAEGAFGLLDAIVSVALGTLGVFVGLAAGRRDRDLRRFALAGAIESMTTALVVSAVIGVLLLVSQAPLDARFWAVTLTLGVTAAASSAGAAEFADSAADRATTLIADLDDLAPIVIGGMLVAWIGGLGDPARTARLVALTAAIGLSGGLVGSLLTTRARSEHERTVFAIGAVLIVAGGAAYVSASPLAAGLVAGLCWSRGGRQTGAWFSAELQKLQHPTVLLLLITAGLGLRIDVGVLGLAVPLVIVRVGGKLVGASLVRRVVPGDWPAALGVCLIPPGVLGLGFALNVHQVTGTDISLAVVSAAALAAIAGELLGLALSARARRR